MIDLSGRVAIVTGAGAGLGREHALLLARHGARVVVNDVAAAEAESVASEIVAAGGDAISDGVFRDRFRRRHRDGGACDRALASRVDILVNNAGILRDRTFAKMALDDFRLVMEVHLMGSVHCTKAVWEHMRARKYGRIVMTTSSSGLYGNFGQSNYGAAKMALVGLMQTLAIEGARVRHPRELHRAHRRNPDVGGAAAAAGARAAASRACQPGRAGARARGRAQPHDPLRGRRLVRDRAHHLVARRVPRHRA